MNICAQLVSYYCTFSASSWSCTNSVVSSTNSTSPSSSKSEAGSGLLVLNFQLYSSVNDFELLHCGEKIYRIIVPTTYDVTYVALFFMSPCTPVSMRKSAASLVCTTFRLAGYFLAQRDVQDVYLRRIYKNTFSNEGFFEKRRFIQSSRIPASTPRSWRAPSPPPIPWPSCPRPRPFSARRAPRPPPQGSAPPSRSPGKNFTMLDVLAREGLFLSCGDILQWCYLTTGSQ